MAFFARTRVWLGVLVFSSFIFWSGQGVQANVGDAFGFGSQSMALGGAAGTLSNATAVYHNPAILGAQEGAKFQFNYGFIYVDSAFKAINGVTTQNSYIADGTVTGNVDVSYKPTVGQSFSFSYRLFPELMNFTFGALTFLPFNQAAFMDTGETYVPEYVLYRARTQRPQIELGAGGRIADGFFFGVGIHTAFVLSGNATAFIASSSTSASSLRFTTSLTPKLAPYVGLFYAPTGSSWKASTVFRAPAASDATLTMKSSARILSPAAAPDFNLTATSALFYDPMALELGGSCQVSDSLKLLAQLDYQIWNQFKSPALNVQQTSQDLSGSLTIAPGITPAFNFVNIVVPRAGAEIALSDMTQLRLGYYYRPSFISGAPNGPGNYLDPSKHALNLGMGLKFAHVSGLENPLQLDFNLTYHYLVPFTVTKPAGNEIGGTGSMIGAPGYEVGGSLYGGGVSLALAF